MKKVLLGLLLSLTLIGCSSGSKELINENGSVNFEAVSFKNDSKTIIPATDKNIPSIAESMGLESNGSGIVNGYELDTYTYYDDNILYSINVSNDSEFCQIVVSNSGENTSVKPYEIAGIKINETKDNLINMLGDPTETNKTENTEELYYKNPEDENDYLMYKIKNDKVNYMVLQIKK